MATAQNDLYKVLAQGNSLMDEVLDLSHKLVVDVKAEHYWTVYSLETLAQLKNITRNLARMLEDTKDAWGKPAEFLLTPDGIKLWRTAVGLQRALPKVRAKYIEQLARRRRQRIMGQDIEDVEELDPEVLAEEEKKYRHDLAELRKAIEALRILMERLPDGMVADTEAMARILAGEQVKREEAEATEPAAEPGAAEAETAAGQSLPTAPEAPKPVERDEISPV
ncbi:hypothetical protein JW859_06730 [bacterium]|nr:hypothetical protein [bacterium]